MTGRQQWYNILVPDAFIIWRDLQLTHISSIWATSSPQPERGCGTMLQPTEHSGQSFPQLWDVPSDYCRYIYDHTDLPLQLWQQNNNNKKTQYHVKAMFFYNLYSCTSPLCIVLWLSVSWVRVTCEVRLWQTTSLFTGPRFCDNSRGRSC